MGIIFALIVIIFVGFFTYYLWQIRYGEESTIRELNTKFSKKITINPSQELATSTVADVKYIIRPYDPTVGEKEAPIAIITFIDFECPYCQESYPIFKQITEKYAPAVRVVFKHLPFSNLHPQAMNAALAATCAQEQNKFWEYYDILFTTKQLDDTSLYAYAKQLSLNESQFSNCIKNKKYKQHIDQDSLDAVSAGMRGTPTYIVNGKIYEGVLSIQEWDTIILSNLKQS